MEHLFSLYERLTALLALATKTKPKRGSKGIYSKPIAPGKSTPQSEADAAHCYSVMEESPPLEAK